MMARVLRPHIRLTQKAVDSRQFKHRKQRKAQSRGSLPLHTQPKDIENAEVISAVVANTPAVPSSPRTRNMLRSIPDTDHIDEVSDASHNNVGNCRHLSSTSGPTDRDHLRGSSDANQQTSTTISEPVAGWIDRSQLQLMQAGKSYTMKMHRARPSDEFGENVLVLNFYNGTPKPEKSMDISSGPPPRLKGPPLRGLEMFLDWLRHEGMISLRHCEATRRSMHDQGYGFNDIREIEASDWEAMSVPKGVVLAMHRHCKAFAVLENSGLLPDFDSTTTSAPRVMARRYDFTSDNDEGLPYGSTHYRNWARRSEEL